MGRIFQDPGCNRRVALAGHVEDCRTVGALGFQVECEGNVCCPWMLLNKLAAAEELRFLPVREQKDDVVAERFPCQERPRCFEHRGDARAAVTRAEGVGTRIEMTVENDGAGAGCSRDAGHDINNACAENSIGALGGADCDGLLDFGSEAQRFKLGDNVVPRGGGGFRTLGPRLLGDGFDVTHGPAGRKLSLDRRNRERGACGELTLGNDCSEGNDHEHRGHPAPFLEIHIAPTDIPQGAEVRRDSLERHVPIHPISSNHLNWSAASILGPLRYFGCGRAARLRRPPGRPSLRHAGRVYRFRPSKRRG